MNRNKKAGRNGRIISIILMAALIIAFISGILIRPLGDSMLMLAVHKLFALILVISSIFHILQYKKKKEVTHVS